MLDLPEDLPDVLVDPGLLERVLDNLLAERRPARPAGTPVRLSGSRLGNRLELRVVDRGPGVPDADKERVFAPFQRLGDRSSSAYGAGVGLGLAVAARVRRGDGRDAVGRGHPGRRADDDRRAAGGRTVTRVLLVDDEPQLLRALGINLRARGHEVVTAATGAQALAAVEADRPDVVVLDLGLPDLDGVEVLRRLRAWTRVPVVVLSARRDLADKVEALDAGADDYLVKPFAVDELLARLRAALRRGTTDRDEPAVETAAFTVDLARSQVLRDGEVVHLTPTEWKLLEVLARHSGRLVGSRQLLQEVWGPAYGTETHYLRLYLARLRRKLEPEPVPAPAPAHRTRAGSAPGAVTGGAPAGVGARGSRCGPCSWNGTDVTITPGW